MASWHLMAGEYPPEVGGVGAYTAELARGLTACGDEVHVWARGDAGSEAGAATVHRVGGTWSKGDLQRVGRLIDETPGPRRILVQFAPNAWGFKGMNPALAGWLAGRKRRGDDARVVFHELWYFPVPGDRPARRVLSAIQRGLALSLLRASSRAYVTIPYWAECLRKLPGGKARPIDWLPVTSNIRPVDDPAGVAAIREGLGEPVVGHFGTYAGRIGDMLAAALPAVLDACPGAVALLIGLNGEQFAARLSESRPDLAPRMRPTGGLDDAGVSQHLRACDVLVQPYPDGLTSRRTTAMAGLEHGLPIVTTVGRMCEPVWAESGGVVLVPEDDPEAMARETARLLADPARRDGLAAAARATYDRWFAVERLVERLRGGEF